MPHNLSYRRKAKSIGLFPSDYRTKKVVIYGIDFRMLSAYISGRNINLLYQRKCDKMNSFLYKDKLLSKENGEQFTYD